MRSLGRVVYDFCRRHVDRVNGDNNSDMRTNGESRLLLGVLPRCRVVFDVGANVGDWTAIALGINRELEVHCFEPSPATFSRLSTRPFPGKVVLNNIGLGSARGAGELLVFGDGSGMNSLYRREGLEAGWGVKPQERREKVTLDTIDGYCRDRSVERVDYLKVDVEGHELEVFKGARAMLETGRIGQVQFEYGGTYIDSRILLKDVFEFFQGLPYSLCKVHPRSLVGVGRYDSRLENFQYQNWVAVRKG